MGARQSTRKDTEVTTQPAPPPVRRDGLNTPAAALCAAGTSCLLAYRLTAPRAVTSFSPGAAAARALALGTLLSVGTFSFIIGGLAAAYDVRTAPEAVAKARHAAPPGLRLTSEASPADEAAWKRIDADLTRAWDVSDWTAFDDACRKAFSRITGD
jgi:hypothetical protein